MHPCLEKVLLNEEEIVARCKELGQQITQEYKNNEQPPLLVALLKGSVPFLAELIKHIDLDIQFDFMDVSSYEGTESIGDIKIIKDLDEPLEGKNVIIVEDIIDSGSTLKMICEMFHERKPASIKICTLLDKPTGRKVELKPDYTCFTVPPAFVVGFGLDYEDYYRNLPFVGVLKPSVYQDR